MKNIQVVRVTTVVQNNSIPFAYKCVQKGCGQWYFILPSIDEKNHILPANHDKVTYSDKALFLMILNYLVIYSSML